MNFFVVTITRWILSILLLVTIGYHAHWSVTLAFTLLILNAEQIAALQMVRKLVCK